MAVEHTLHYEPLTPEILTTAGWEEAKIKLSKCRVFDKYEDFDDGYLNPITVTFLNAINRISIEYSNGKTSIRLTKPQPITVGEFNALLDIVKLNKFKISNQ